MALTPLPAALDSLFQQVPSAPTSEHEALSQCLWRVLAEPIVAGIDVPGFDNSAMDGYAVRAAELPGPLPVSQRIPAGVAPRPLERGSVARIFTGAVLPEGADTVVMQEDVLDKDGQLTLLGSITEGQHIRRRAADICSGAEILPAGRVLTPQDIGLAASVGCATLPVRRPLRVAVLATGDELATPGEHREDWQIYNSNAAQIGAQITAMGMQAVSFSSLPDDPLIIGDVLERAAAQVDCIITCGGVSVGEEDHVRGQIEARGTLTLWKLAIKPGKPLAFGQVAGCPVFGLPGNPVAAWTTFALVVRPWLAKAQGAYLPNPRRLQVRADFEVNRAGSREEYLRVNVLEGQPRVAQKTPDQSSGVLSGVCQAQGLAVIPIGVTVRRGDLVDVILMTELLSPLVA